jgi:DNA polymerase-3 subunit delta'
VSKGFGDILGQDAAVATLRRALASGRVHHAYRFEGPDGVGKERAAFALAQALVCTENGGTGDGCGACSACNRAVTITTAEPHVSQHPDVILIERGLYSPAVLGRSREETADISVDQIRKVLGARLSFPPHEARARMVIVRRAEELSISAANALLKTLEEPPPGTHFVLLSARPRELIDTIRSRSLPVRFAPLGDAVLTTILASRGITGDVARAAVDLAAGSAARAVEHADPAADEPRTQFVEAVLAAVDSPDASKALAVAQTKDKDRDVLADRLAAVAAALARRSKESAAGAPDAARKDAERYVFVAQAMAEIDRNAAPALLLESMILRMRGVV